MPATPSPEAAVVADLVGLGTRLEAAEATHQTMSDPEFDAWYVAEGWRWMGMVRGKRIPLMGLYLVRRAARIRPAWVKAEAVDLDDPLADQLLELAAAIEEISARQEREREQ